jgi:hypothetical protein
MSDMLHRDTRSRSAWRPLLIPNANLRNPEVRSLKFKLKERNTEGREAVKSSPLERKKRAGLESEAGTNGNADRSYTDERVAGRSTRLMLNGSNRVPIGIQVLSLRSGYAMQ